MILRNVGTEDVDAYVRMRCDPAMMSELGGPLPREGIEAKVLKDAAEAAADTSWIFMIVPDETEPSVVAGNVVLWTNDEHADAPYSETGWMVLPEFQGQGLAKAAVRLLLERARDDGRWGLVHAYPGATNGPSNGICRTLGFTLLGEVPLMVFGDRPMLANHWRLDPATDLVAGP